MVVLQIVNASAHLPAKMDLFQLVHVSALVTMMMKIQITETTIPLMILQMTLQMIPQMTLQIIPQTILLMTLQMILLTTQLTTLLTIPLMTLQTILQMRQMTQ